ncbi:MAG: tetratricopeptide repeat protein [Planctomycetota bacterium]
MTRRSGHIRQSAKSLPVSSLRTQTADPRRRWINRCLALVILGGAVYLFGDVDPTSKSSPITRSEAPITSSEVPIITYSIDPRGFRRATVDEAKLRQWCRANKLPDPPDLADAETTVIKNLLDSLREVTSHATAETLGKLGKICENQLAHASADEYFKRATETDPKDFRWPYYRGVIRQVTGQNEAATELFLASAKLNPAYPTTFARLGQLCLDLGRTEDAQRHFSRFVELSPNDWFGYLGQGRVALERGDLQNALRFLEEAEKRGPHDFQVRYYLGRAHQALGNTAEAEANFAKARELPQGAWFAGRDPLAQELRRAADSADALVKEFERLVDSGDLPKLASLAEQIIERRPDDVTMMSALASIYRRLSRPTEAKEVLDRAKALAPNSARVVSVSAELLFAENRMDEALVAADRALLLDPETALALGIRGRVLLQQNHLAEAETVLRRAAQLRPNDASSLVVLGESLRLQGKTEEAITLYKRALEIRPDYEAAKKRLTELSGQ